MIVTSNIEDILYDDCKSVGISEIYEKGNVPSGEVTTERIVILSSDQIPSTIWKKCFVEVNLVTPDLPNENGALEANKIRLKELERKVGWIYAVADVMIIPQRSLNLLMVRYLGLVTMW